MIYNTLRLGLLLTLLLSLAIFYTHSQDDTIQMLLDEAESNKQDGDYQAALKNYQEALNNQVKTPSQEAKIYLGLGVIYGSQFLGEKEKNLEYLKKAEALAKKSKEYVLQTKVANQLALYYEVEENYYRAENYYQQAFEVAQKAKNEDESAFAKLHLASIKILRGDYYLAIDYLKSLEDKLQDSPKRDRFLAVLYNNIAASYDRLQNDEKAIEWHKKAMKYNLKFFGKPNHPIILLNYSNLASQYTNAKQLDSAQKYLDTFFEYQNENTSIYRLTSAYNLQGLVRQGKGKVQEARALFEKARQLYSENYGDKNFDVAYSYQLVAENYLKIKKFDKALQHIQLALISNHQTFANKNWKSNPPNKDIIVEDYQLELLDVKMDICLQAFSQTQSITYLEQSYEIAKRAIDYIDLMRQQYSTEKTVLFVGEKALKTYQKAMLSLYWLWQNKSDKQYLELAFQVAERSKSYQLMRSLNEQTLRQSYAENSLVSKETELLHQINLLKNEISEDSLANNDAKHQLADLQKQRERLLSKIKQEIPSYYQSRFTIEQLSSQDVQSNLAPDQALVEYFLTDSLVYCFTIDNKTLKLQQKPLPKDWKNHIPTLRKAILNKDFDIYTKQAHSLYQLLWADNELTKSAKKVLVIPDGILNYLPMECLISEKSQEKSNYKSLTYLLKKYRFHYHYSATLAYQSITQERGSKPLNIVAFAPHFESNTSRNPTPTLISQREVTRENLAPLPAAQQEVQMLHDYFPVNSFVGPRASKANFKQFSPKSTVLHLATHAIVDDDNTLKSRLLFNQDDSSSSDNTLYAYELKNMQLEIDLVTLSACNTGIGNIQQGEGVMSLARSFMNAGAKSVLMSLWAVSDESTAQLMRLFYKNLRKGLDKDEALHQAKLKYLESSDRNGANPYYWAGFVLIGEEKSVVASSGLDFWSYFLGALALGVLFIIALMWRYQSLRKSPKRT